MHTFVLIVRSCEELLYHFATQEGIYIRILIGKHLQWSSKNTKMELVCKIRYKVQMVQSILRTVNERQ